ncbi:sel1 repeat family protein [Tabrizicola sp. M-4]|uniref:SEL1-like repeat protein n=1 Tax=Tabrizicola sp. M-4 TaxID=3055847 RepID=UPI003DA9FF46
MTARPAPLALCLALSAAFPAHATDERLTPILAAQQTTGTTLSEAMAELRAGRAPEGATILLFLARQGGAEAQFNLALLYSQGLGVPQNTREALYWAWRARLGGIAPANALIQRLGQAATPELRTELVTRITADLEPRIASGDGRAMLEQSILLAELLPKPDLAAAYAWQALSAALGTPNAAAARDATLAQIPAKDQLAAQDAAVARLRDLCKGGMQGHALCATLP